MARNKAVEASVKALVAELLVRGGAMGGGGVARIFTISNALAELGELQVLSKRVWRAAERIGEARVEECRAASD
jgi:ATP-dependent exoDNAse (exonuclease V) alpha subunit